MKIEFGELAEQIRRRAVVALSGGSPEATAIKRMHAINEKLKSQPEGFGDVFRYSLDSGYKGRQDVYALRVDLSDPATRGWLQNVARGIDNSLRQRDQRALIVHNQILESQCKPLPNNGFSYV